MKEQKNIENIFKEAFEDFELDPGKNAWQKVQSGLNSGLASSAAASSAATSSWAVTAIVALVISGVAIGGYYFFNQQGEAKLEASFENNELKTESNDISNSIQEIESDKFNSADNKLTQTPSTGNAEINKTESKRIETPTISKTKELNNENSDIKQSDLEGNISSEPSKSTNFVKQKVVTEKESEESNSIANESSSSTTKSDAEVKAQEEATIETDATKESNESKDNDLVESTPPIQPPSLAEDTIHLDFPNAVSPNYDRKNDVLEITKELSKGLEYVDNVQVTIINNTGKTIAQYKGINGSWDCLLQNGSLAPSGVYFYICNYAVNGEIHKPKNGSFKIF